MNKARTFFLYVFICSVFARAQLKVLHLTFHRGCSTDFLYVAQQLNLDLTTWLIDAQSRKRFDGIEQISNDVVNIGPGKAQVVWDLNKEYFNSFDVIVTSDTAPLARIFLQNSWAKPLIIWICNRFDYHDDGYNPERFPDRDYYQLMRQAAQKPNVAIIGYTAFEHFYARERNVDTGHLIIKPCGVTQKTSDFVSAIPEYVDKQNTFFIPPREGAGYLYGECIKLGIPVYTGIYNGPHDLKEFKGIIHWPYQWSNLALFENLALGLVYLIPSAACVRQWLHNPVVGLWYPMSQLDAQLLELAEWWNKEHQEVIVHFDSWDDLKYKIDTLDFEHKRTAVKKFSIQHRQEMLRRWRTVFDVLAD